ncbi:MAG: CRTAC1 family protein [Planctomycetota bacterium]
MSRLFLIPGGLLLACIFVVVLCWKHWFQLNVDELVTQANVAFEVGDIQTALQRARQVLSTDPNNAAGLLIVGRCQEARGFTEAAAQTFDEVPTGQSPYSCEAAWRCGHLQLLTLGHPREAERCYLRAIEDDPQSLMANEGLTVLWGFSGQWWRQIRPRLAMLRSGKVHRVHLLSLALAENSLDVSLDASQMRSTAPHDPHVLLAMARLATEKEDYSSAIHMLQATLRKDPGLVQAQVRLGESYFETGDTPKFTVWSRNLPVVAEEHPTVWVLRGKWAQGHSTPESALRCFCEAIRRDANQPDALYQAGQILNGMQRPEDAAPFLKRARDLQRFLNVVKAADHNDDLAGTRRAAELAESLGNTWEAFGWAFLASEHPTKPQWALQLVDRLQPRLNDLPLTRTEAKRNPVASFDFESLPLPAMSDVASDALADRDNGRESREISFQDVAPAAGVRFQYFNGSETVGSGTRFMYEVMGGGVAVLDINGDLRPDLYFTQGGRWPVNESVTEHLDRLYVNQGDGHFTDVTELCGIRENRFGQGVAAGDFDSDGFPDLLVANIGGNRLYRNHGDGTFSDVSAIAELVRSDWSTSCTIADVTGDGQPELYFANYLQGDDVFTRTCGPDGSGVCLPQHFDAADDRLFWNQGDGSFEDVTHTSGVGGASGKGLGVVVAAFDGAQRPNIFVANDTVMNSYFVNRTADSREPPRLNNEALVSGLAMSAEGRTQACMGVAAGDANGDGQLELFVTNFHGESNALYQRSGGAFQDVVMNSGLRQASLSKLGFGTQFLDADLDGQSDLIVANGHIDNFIRDGRTEYQMPAQFFANAWRGEFVEVEPSVLRAYFQRKVLGRSLARLDWNGDGLEEAVVTHLDAPVALLQNTTKHAGGFLSLRLRGVMSSRDAIGATVEIKLGDRRVTRQLTAGDGFQASNERVLVFGLGDQKTVSTMIVHWPSGIRSEFGPLQANTHWISVEGAGRLYSVVSNPALQDRP